MVKSAELDNLATALSLPKNLLKELHSARVKVWDEIFETFSIEEGDEDGNSLDELVEFYDRKPRRSSKMNCSLIRMTTRALARSKNFSVIIKHPSKKNNANTTVANTTHYKCKNMLVNTVDTNEENNTKKPIVAKDNDFLAPYQDYNENNNPNTTVIDNTMLKNKNLLTNDDDSNKKNNGSISCFANNKDFSTIVESSNKKKYINLTPIQKERMKKTFKKYNINVSPVTKRTGFSTITKKSEEEANTNHTITYDSKIFTTTTNNQSEKSNISFTAALNKQNLSANKNYNINSNKVSIPVSNDKEISLITKQLKKKENVCDTIDNALGNKVVPPIKDNDGKRKTKKKRKKDKKQHKSKQLQTKITLEKKDANKHKCTNYEDKENNYEVFKSVREAIQPNVHSGKSHSDKSTSCIESERCYLKLTDGEKNNTSEDRDILIYCPEIREILPLECILSNNKFFITEEFLSWYIGKQAAKKFFKYNIEGLCFSLTSCVYLKELKEGILFIPEKADDDLIDLIGECGYIYEIQN